MKKITILALHLGVGGAEQFILSLANILSKENEVEIVSTYKLTEKPAFYTNSNVKITYLMEELRPNRSKLKDAIESKNPIKIIKEGIYSLKVLYYRKKLMIKAIKNCNSDIIISTRVLHNKWLGKYGKSSSIKIAQEHNHHNNNNKVIRKTISSLKNIDYFMPTSKELTDFYASKLNNKEIKCVYLPHWVEYFPQDNEVSNLNNKELVAVGRLSKEKGFEDLIDVFNLAHNIEPDIKLKIVGDGQEKNNIQEKIIKYDLQDCVKLLGSKNRKELNEIYKNSSLYVMTSYTESFGLVLIEAESFKLPIIAFDSAQGAHEIIQNNVNGFLIKNRNKELMAKKIIDLINDEDLRVRIGTDGRKLAEKYKIENVSIIWNNFIRKICGEDES